MYVHNIMYIHGIYIYIVCVYTLYYVHTLYMYIYIYILGHQLALSLSWTFGMAMERDTWNPKVALISCRFCENYRLSAFGTKNRRLKQKPTTLVINRWTIKNCLPTSANVSQHPRVQLFAADRASGERGHARRIRKNTAFFHIFSIFSFD